jgi:hypothetical protein
VHALVSVAARSISADEWRPILLRLGAALPATEQRHVTLIGGLSDSDEVWTFVGGTVPVAKHAQARHNLYVLWEMIHEPA